MGTLKFAILGLLSRKKMTGYELTKEFETSLCEFWSAKHSQIYPELRHLHEEGLVEYEIEIAGTSLEKKLYSITGQGQAEFTAWLEKRRRLQPTPKDEFRLQLFFSDALSPEQRTAVLQDQLEQHRERLKHLLANREKFDGVPDTGTAGFSDYLVLMGAVMREETNCSWLERCIELCGSATGSPSSPED